MEEKSLREVYAEIRSLDIPELVEWVLDTEPLWYDRYLYDLITFRAKLNFVARVLPEWEAITALVGASQGRRLEEILKELAEDELRGYFNWRRRGEWVLETEYLLNRRMYRRPAPKSVSEFVLAELEAEKTAQKGQMREARRLHAEAERVAEAVKGTTFSWAVGEALESGQREQLERLERLGETFFTAQEIEMVGYNLQYLAWAQKHPRAAREYPIWHEMDGALQREKIPDWLLNAGLEHPDPRIAAATIKLGHQRAV